MGERTIFSVGQMPTLTAPDLPCWKSESATRSPIIAPGGPPATAPVPAPTIRAALFVSFEDNESLLAIAVLATHRQRIGRPFAGPIFASATGTPLNMNNLLHRGILPILNRCGTCGKPQGSAHGGHDYGRDGSLPEWHGFHAFRRGLGTNLKGLGVDLKTIQEILRHAHISTTADIYVKEVSADSVRAMLKFERKLNAYRADAARPSKSGLSCSEIAAACSCHLWKKE